MSLQTIKNFCDGGGAYVGAIESFNGMRRTVCKWCGNQVPVNKSGTLRKHEGKTLVAPPRWEFDPEEPVLSVAQMRDGATTLKRQLQHTYEINKDPRFRRLWQHALALEVHLTRMHNNQAFDSASVQLAAYKAGNGVGA